jgi:molybdopterin converting factor small subunit
MAEQIEMIHLKFLGHIKTSLGVEELDISQENISVGELFGFLLARAPAQVSHGFSKYNTLVVLNDEEVFSASQDDRRITDGDSVLLVPFSHGG